MTDEELKIAKQRVENAEKLKGEINKLKGMMADVSDGEGIYLRFDMRHVAFGKQDVKPDGDNAVISPLVPAFRAAIVKIIKEEVDAKVARLAEI